MINNLPTVYEVVTGVAKKQSKAPNGSSKSSKSNSKVSIPSFCCVCGSKASIRVPDLLCHAFVNGATPQAHLYGLLS
jgi:hypothetical protein